MIAGIYYHAEKHLNTWICRYFQTTADIRSSIGTWSGIINVFGKEGNKKNDNDTNKVEELRKGAAVWIGYGWQDIQTNR